MMKNGIFNSNGNNIGWQVQKKSIVTCRLHLYCKEEHWALSRHNPKKPVRALWCYLVIRKWIIYYHICESQHYPHTAAYYIN